MDSLNIANSSKTSAFKKSKLLLYKHYPSSVEAYKKQANRLDIR